MQTIQLTTQVGKDGILQIKMPENMREQNLNVTLVFESISELNYPENAQINAWGKCVTSESIQETIEKLNQLKQEINIPQQELREMIEEGRRF
jgi:molecular chaperone DnaK (HSP70)